MPIGPISSVDKPQVSGVISKMLGRRTFRAQPEDEGMAETMPGTFSRAEFGLPTFDPASARRTPVPVPSIMSPAQRARETAAGPGEIGGGIAGTVNGAQPSMPPSPTGPGGAPAPGTGGVPFTGRGGTGPAGGISMTPRGGGSARGGDDVGISQGNAPGDNMFARGGIITKPTKAVVGEQGPEAIIPLHDPLAAQRASNELARGAMKRGDWKTALNALRRSAAGDSKGDPGRPPLYPEPPGQPGGGVEAASAGKNWTQKLEAMGPHQPVGAVLTGQRRVGADAPPITDPNFENWYQQLPPDQKIKYKHLYEQWLMNQP